jgi:hypothetical protein
VVPFSHPPEVRAAALSLVQSGALPSAAAAEVGADTSTVYSWLRTDCPSLIGPLRRCFRCWPEVPTDLAAYSHLLGLYLGDGWLGAGPRGSWSLAITCDDAYPALADECAEAMRSVLATSVCRVRKRGCHDVKSYSSHWPCLLPQHGRAGSTSGRSCWSRGSARS